MPLTLKYSVLSFGALLILAAGAPAEPISTLMEKAVYTEETTGNLDEAIKLYQQIVRQSEADRAVIAQAHYRLGLCLLKKDRKTDAIEAFKKVTTLFADQKDIAAKASDQLKTLQFEPLKIQPAPWADGEVMRLRVSSMAGGEMGTNIYMADATDKAGKKLWLIRSHLMITMSNMLQETAVEADRDTFAPLTGRTMNSELGDYRAVYEPKKVTLTTQSKGKETIKPFDINGPVFDNEQALFLIRRLPLAEGYKASFTIFSVMGAQTVECRIEITGKEKVTVPAGVFDCLRMNLQVWSQGTKALEHQLWFSQDAHRYLVKYDSTSALMELTGVSTASCKPTLYSNSNLAGTLTLPAGWFAYPYPEKENGSVITQLLSPEIGPWCLLAALPGTKEVLADSTVRQIADGDISTLKGYFKNYTVRPNSRSELKIGGLPASRFTADYDDNGVAMVEYRTYILGDNVWWFVFRTAKDQFAKMQPIYDAIVDGFKPSPPPMVTATTPKVFANDVPATLKAISVTFDRQMTNDNWSWTNGGKNAFPKAKGTISYDDAKRTCSLPVDLEPGKVYWVGINEGQYQSFTSSNGVPAKTSVILFATKSADGKPTPIPDALIADAKQILDHAQTAGSRPAASQPTTANAMAMLDDVTRSKIDDFEQGFSSWFQPESKYEASSASEKEATVEQWMADARSDDFKKRTRAIAALGNIRCKEAVGVLIDVAEEPMSNNRPKWMAVRALGRIGDKAAVPTLIELIDHGNTNVRVYSRLALTQITGQYLGESKEQWRAWWKEHGQQAGPADKKTAENQSAKGWRLWSQQKFDQAEVAFKDAVRSDPANANAWQGLGWSQFNERKMAQAKDSFEKCLALEKTNAAALNGLGWIAKSQDKTDEAIGFWEQAVKAEPKGTAAIRGLAITYMEKNQPDKAAQYFEMWLKAEPNNEEAQQGLKNAKHKTAEPTNR